MTTRPAAIATMRSRFISAAQGMGVSRSAAIALANKLLGVRSAAQAIPGSRSINLHDNASSVRSHIASLQASINQQGPGFTEIRALLNNRSAWPARISSNLGFRYFVERAAADLKLTGYTRNLDDGRVEVYAVGSPAKLAELSQQLWKGPRFADVRGVEQQEAAYSQVVAGPRRQRRRARRYEVWPKPLLLGFRMAVFAVVVSTAFMLTTWLATLR